MLPALAMARREGRPDAFPTADVDLTPVPTAA
jgi:hypothetical protein